MSKVSLILHERKNDWYRQLRPRLAGRPVRWSESRSTSDLTTALVGQASPLILIALEQDFEAGLRDLAWAAAVSRDALILVLDGGNRPEILALARELGATQVLAGWVPPPRVASTLDRWVGLALSRSRRVGWDPNSETAHDGDPIEWATLG